MLTKKNTLSILIAVATVLFCAAFSMAAQSGCSGIYDGYVRTAGQVIDWKNQSDAKDYETLRSWCLAVGPPVLLDASGSNNKLKALDSLVIASWNTHVGGGDLGRFVSDLRTGRLTAGEPVEDFVLLVQEVFRSGPLVPATVPHNARMAALISETPPEGVRVDIVETAREQGLGLLYIPSMRNGRPREGTPAEDRGNAILSTIPLSSPISVELPFERQRRVAISASVSGETTSGTPWTVQVINVHLENRARWRRVFHSFGRCRLNQVTALLEALPVNAPRVMGGDFNTWFRGPKEPAIRHVEESFDRPANVPEGGTVKPGFILPKRTVDYMFFRVPNNWLGEYELVDDTYGSDHYPLLGRLRIGN
jgi:endonuclease/exonuclease/phosphatase family metal-dependent hydrolase